jgi:hypothetical protein
MTRPLVIAANYREFSDWCHSQQLRENDATYIRYPDQLRGQQTDRVVWLTTPERWSKGDVADARMSAKLAARIGDNPTVEGLPAEEFSAADLIGIIHSHLKLSDVVTCGNVSSRTGTMTVRSQDGGFFRINVEEI